VAWLRVQDLKLMVAERTLVEGATFRLDPGDRVAVVGPNGMGKTTLFRTLNGTLEPESGQIETSTEFTVAVLDQLHRLPDGTVYDIAANSHHTLAAWGQELRALESRLENPSEPDFDAVLSRYAIVQQHFQDHGGYEWDAKVRQALMGAGLDESRFFDRVDSLSGGERHRLALVTVILSGADLWLLDEPTNHLDIGAMEWLESTLSAFGGLVLLSSHDRRFLDRSATRIMTWEDGFFWMMSGSYHHYLQLREERLRDQARAWQRYQEEHARLLAYVDRYRAGNRATQAKSRLHALDRLNQQAPSAAPIRHGTPTHLSHAGQAAKGLTALTINQLQLSRGDRAWEPITFKVPAKSRLCIQGPNGCGKTTLLRALVANEPGVTWHPGATLSYYDQEAATLLADHPTGMELANEEGMDRETIYYLGARFELTPELLSHPAGTWSGGERSRLALLFALMTTATVLILDEPTNHLDIAMRRELENLLQGYPGAVILVSHDRELMDNVGTHLLWWENDHFRFQAGRYSELVAHSG
jgi:ATP-binding cassette subfamily F protein 3